jgi:SHS2 domain-containing protein
MPTTIEHLDHTADLGLRVAAETVEEAFCEAARGLFGLMLDLRTVRPRAEYAVHLVAASNADLLVEWLSDLLAQKELTGQVFSEFKVEIGRTEGRHVLDGVALGERFDPERHRPRIEVKGITYLGLEVRRRDTAWTAQFVVDV